MTLYDEMISSAERMNAYALSIEIDNDPMIIKSLRREGLQLKKMAADFKDYELEVEHQKRYIAQCERMLFYELLRQRDTLFLERIKPIVGMDDFDWRAQHQLFTDQEICSAISAVIEKEKMR